jgi:hypothetical protein
MSDLNQSYFSPDFRKQSSEISNLKKFHPVRAELFHLGGRTDVTKLIVALGSFANAPKTHGGY